MIDERGLTDAYKDSVGETLAEIDHALDRIDSRLKGADLGWLERDGDVFWFFLAAKLRELQEHAAEIDTEYDSDTVL